MQFTSRCVSCLKSRSSDNNSFGFFGAGVLAVLCAGYYILAWGYQLCFQHFGRTRQCGPRVFLDICRLLEAWGILHVHSRAFQRSNTADHWAIHKTQKESQPSDRASDGAPYFFHGRRSRRHLLLVRGLQQRLQPVLSWQSVLHKRSRPRRQLWISYVASWFLETKSEAPRLSAS